jgi:glucose/arabinose dehydrogenase
MRTTWTRRSLLWISVVAVAGALACSRAAATATDGNRTDPCDPDNTGLTLPSEFCASVFADNLGHARHLVVAPNGDVYVNTWSQRNNTPNPPGGFIVALRDKDHDGRAETIERFGAKYEPGKPGGGTGIAIHDGALYVESLGTIVRYMLAGDQLVPTGAPETIVSGLPLDGDHTMHPFAIANDGTLYVNSGSATNSCQLKNRTLESPGQQPCKELEIRAGIWSYTTTKTGQVHSPSSRFIAGTRNVVALAVHPTENVLYAVPHGRDQLGDNWPKLYTAKQNNELPAEIFIRAQAGQDYGWPTCYFDPAQKKHVLAPEYGGDGGKKVGPCASKAMPLSSFPAHWAPEAMAFASQALPEHYQGGVFVSFHGSWNRTPAQSGFLVAFVPIKDQKAGNYEEFAKGFSGKGDIADPKAAPYRPMGVAFAPDGTMYVSDDVKGRVWRIALKKR